MKLFQRATSSRAGLDGGPTRPRPHPRHLSTNSHGMGRAGPAGAGHWRPSRQFHAICNFFGRGCLLKLSRPVEIESPITAAQLPVTRHGRNTRTPAFLSRQSAAGLCLARSKLPSSWNRCSNLALPLLRKIPFMGLHRSSSTHGCPSHANPRAPHPCASPRRLLLRPLPAPAASWRLQSPKVRKLW